MGTTQECCSSFEQILEAAPTKQQLYSQLTHITQAMQVRHVEHSWWLKDNLVSDILLQTPKHKRANVERL